jgi:hypothetical protein
LVTNGIVRKSPSDGARVWACRCDCGNVTMVRATSLTSGFTKSCGCLRIDRLKANGDAGREAALVSRRRNAAMRLYDVYLKHFPGRDWDLLSENEKERWIELSQVVYIRSKKGKDDGR